jgi:hypothetical protein
VSATRRTDGGDVINYSRFVRVAGILAITLSAGACTTSDDGPTREQLGFRDVEPLEPLQMGWSLRPGLPVASPVPEPTGVTFDGSQLWLLGGGVDAETSRLVRYDETHHEVTREVVLDNLAEVPGALVGGIAWDGTSIWIAVTGNLNKLVVVDPLTGAITRTLGSPTMHGPADLSFDGTSLWIGNGDDQVFAMDTSTGSITASLTTTEAFVRNHGVATRTGQVLVSGLFGEGLALFSHDGTLQDQQIYSPGPLCFVGERLFGLSSGLLVGYDVVP